MPCPVESRVAHFGTAALVAAACGGGSGGGGKAKVRMWTWYSEQQAVWPGVIKDFGKSHPTITIENRIFGDTTSYLPASQAGVSAGEPPDILGPQVLAVQYGRAGIAADLQETVGPGEVHEQARPYLVFAVEQARPSGLHWPVPAAALTISDIPIAAVYMRMQRRFVGGSTMGAAKT